MPLYWLLYHQNNQISVVIEPGASPIHARMRAALSNLDEGEFTEGHDGGDDWTAVVAEEGKEVVG
jgi:hypothetical protein